jgi:hypothetical protein
MNLKEYLDNIPPLHTWDGGQTWNTGGLGRRALEIITTIIDQNFPSPRILETGRGNSTISLLYSAIPLRLFRYALTKSFSIV